MGSYVQSNLANGEEIEYQGRVSVWSLVPTLLLGLVLLLFYGLGILLFIWAAIRYYTTELAITNKKVVAKFGFITRETIELNIDKVESIQVNQGILGRIFNFGTIVISGAGNPQAPIPSVSDPLKFRSKFFEIQERE